MHKPEMFQNVKKGKLSRNLKLKQIIIMLRGNVIIPGPAPPPESGLFFLQMIQMIRNVWLLLHWCRLNVPWCEDLLIIIIILVIYLCWTVIMMTLFCSQWSIYRGADNSSLLLVIAHWRFSLVFTLTKQLSSCDICTNHKRERT